MLEKKLRELSEMGLNEVLNFEKDVIYSMLEVDEKFRVLQLISDRIEKIGSIDNAMAEHSERVGFD